MNNEKNTTEEIFKSMLDENQPVILGAGDQISDDVEDRGGSRVMVAMITGKDIIGYLRNGMKEWRDQESKDLDP